MPSELRHHRQVHEQAGADKQTAKLRRHSGLQEVHRHAHRRRRLDQQRIQERRRAIDAGARAVLQLLRIAVERQYRRRARLPQEVVSVLFRRLEQFRARLHGLQQQQILNPDPGLDGREPPEQHAAQRRKRLHHGAAQPVRSVARLEQRPVIPCAAADDHRVDRETDAAAAALCVGPERPVGRLREQHGDGKHVRPTERPAARFGASVGPAERQRGAGPEQAGGHDPGLREPDYHPVRAEPVQAQFGLRPAGAQPNRRLVHRPAAIRDAASWRRTSKPSRCCGD